MTNAKKLQEAVERLADAAHDLSDAANAVYDALAERDEAATPQVGLSSTDPDVIESVCRFASEVGLTVRIDYVALDGSMSEERPVKPQSIEGSSVVTDDLWRGAPRRFRLDGIQRISV